MLYCLMDVFVCVYVCVVWEHGSCHQSYHGAYIEELRQADNRHPSIAKYNHFVEEIKSKQSIRKPGTHT